MILLFAIVTFGLAFVMAAAWAVQRQLHNAGWVDAFWSFGTGIGGAICALYPLAAGPPTARQVVVGLLVLGWSARLGLHIVVRTPGRPEDVRYAQFRKTWGDGFEPRMFGMLMIQAVAAALLDLSVLVAARNPAPGLGWHDLLGGAVLVLSVAGEAVADRQMHRFRSDPANRGKVCDRGLWAWSRHPNYFFETLGWVAYPLLAFDPDWAWGWLAVSGPIFMYWLLAHVSGIPPLEREMLRSRGDLFRAYQARVSAFFPMPPREARR